MIALFRGFLVLAVAVVSFGQPPQGNTLAEQQRAAAIQGGTARVAGRVTAVGTGAPISGADVCIFSHDEPRGEWHVTTDARGRFQFPGLKPNLYSVVPQKSGYVFATGPARERTLKISAGERIETVHLALQPGATVSGTVRDESGAPVPGIEVRLLNRVRSFDEPLSAGETAWASLPATTDASGRYRIAELWRGAFYVYAIVRPTTATGEDGSRTGPVSTYYPGVTSLAGARTVQVPAGAHVNGIDIKLATGRVVRVSGVVLDSEGRPASLPHLPSLTRLLNPDGPIEIRQRPDGTFAQLLTPGEYTLLAYAAGKEPGLAGRARVTVRDHDLTGLTIRTSTGGQVTGKIVFDGTPPPGERHMSVLTYQTAQDWPPWTGYSTVGADDTFTVRYLFGPRLFRVFHLPPGWVLSAVRLNGKDVTDVPVTFEGNERLTGLELVATDKTTHLRCPITDEKQKPTVAQVMVYSADRTRWGAYSRYCRNEMVTGEKPLVIDGLPPGDYLAVAIAIRSEIYMSRDVEPRDYLRKFATPFTLHEGETKEVPLKVVDAKNGKVGAFEGAGYASKGRSSGTTRCRAGLKLRRYGGP